MAKAKTMNLAGEVMRIDHALLASLKGIRAMAARLRNDIADAATKDALEKYLARALPKKAPSKTKRDKPNDADRRLRKLTRMLAMLPESGIRLVTEVARSVARESHPKEKIKSPKPVPDPSKIPGQTEKE